MAAVAQMYETEAREKKCQALAEYFARVLINTVSEQSPEQWRRAATSAGVNMPSPESQARVIEILRSLRPVQKGWNL